MLDAFPSIFWDSNLRKKESMSLGSSFSWHATLFQPIGSTGPDSIADYHHQESKLQESDQLELKDNNNRRFYFYFKKTLFTWLTIFRNHDDYVYGMWTGPGMKDGHHNNTRMSNRYHRHHSTTTPALPTPLPFSKGFYFIFLAFRDGGWRRPPRPPRNGKPPSLIGVLFWLLFLIF